MPSKSRPQPEQASAKQLADGIHSANIDMFRWEYTCKTEAPYPLNYLPFGEKPQDKMMGIVIGMLIEKGLVFR